MTDKKTPKKSSGKKTAGKTKIENADTKSDVEWLMDDEPSPIEGGEDSVPKAKQLMGSVLVLATIGAVIFAGFYLKSLKDKPSPSAPENIVKVETQSVKTETVSEPAPESVPLAETESPAASPSSTAPFKTTDTPMEPASGSALGNNRAVDEKIERLENRVAELEQSLASLEAAVSSNSGVTENIDPMLTDPSSQAAKDSWVIYPPLSTSGAIGQDAEAKGNEFNDAFPKQVLMGALTRYLETAPQPSAKSWIDNHIKIGKGTDSETLSETYEALIEDAETAAAQGRYALAVEKLEALPLPVRAVASDWLDEARRLR